MSLEEAQEAALDEHNRLRAFHEGTESLKLSADLCEEAQVRIRTLPRFFLNFRLKAYAELLMNQDRFEHADDLDGIGENLASGWNTSETIVDEAKRSTKGWYDEIEFYDYGNPVFASETGHFTQVID